MTPSPAAREVYEIYDISYSHIADLEEDIQIFVIEEKFTFHSNQAFSNDSSILNYVQSFPMIASKNEEEFDLSLSNVAPSVQKSNNCMFWKKYHILRVIHSISLIYSFKQIPT